MKMMHRLFAPRSVCSHDLPYSQLYDETKFYNAFKHDVKRAQREVIIESPFLTVVRVEQLLPILKRLRKRCVRVRIYTRDPKHHTPRLQSQADEAIDLLESSKIKAVCCHDLRHRKIAIIDENILWEGSLNILSQSRSREIMRRTVSSDMCKQMIQFAGIRRRLW